MLGAIAGDIIGSVFESTRDSSGKISLFSSQSHFTDDTVLSTAIADCILGNGDYAERLRYYYRLYPNAGYGKMFAQWASTTNAIPYKSWGNGSAMRVSPVGFAFDSLGRVLNEAERSAEVTHNHPDGIKGAQAIASAVFLARNGACKNDIKRSIQERFGYDLNGSVDKLIAAGYSFNVSCQGSVPQALIVFLEASDFEDGMYKAISIGGDTDTICCMAGALLQAYFKTLPAYIVENVFEILDVQLGQVVKNFSRKYCPEINNI